MRNRIAGVLAGFVLGAALLACASPFALAETNPSTASPNAETTAASTPPNEASNETPDKADAEKAAASASAPEPNASKDNAPAPAAPAPAEEKPQPAQPAAAAEPETPNATQAPEAPEAPEASESQTSEPLAEPSSESPQAPPQEDAAPVGESPAVVSGQEPDGNTADAPAVTDTPANALDATEGQAAPASGNTALEEDAVSGEPPEVPAALEDAAQSQAPETPDASLDEPAPEPAAVKSYARYDASANSLTFYRVAGGQTGDTVYSGFEEGAPFKAATVPWRGIASRVTSIMFADAIAPRYMDYWFYGFTNLASIQGLDKVDTGNTISMKALFQNCKQLTQIDLSSWDVSNVVSMDQLFAGCTSLSAVNTATWNTQSLESLNLAFSRTALETIDVRHFNTSRVTVLSQVFSYNPNLVKVDVTGWDTSAAYTLAGMFEHCPVLTEVAGLEGFTTTGVKYYQSMFQDAPLLPSLNLSSFNTLAAVSMSNMFLNCNSLSTITLGPGWQPRALGAVAAALTPAGALLAENNVSIRALLNGALWRNAETGLLLSVEQLRDDFAPVLAGTWVQAGRLTATLYDDGSLVFGYGEPEAHAPVVASWVDFILNWYGYNDSAQAPWLEYAGSIRSVVFADSFETPFLSEWFRDCKNLASVSGMQNVRLMPVLGRVPGSTSNNPRDWAYGAMNGMFEGCTSLASLDLSGFDAGNVVNIMHLFTNCTALQAVNLNGWNVQNLSNAASLFEGCRSLASVSLDWASAPNLLRVYSMFRDCKSLQVVRIPLLDAPALFMMDGMFDGCRALQEAELAACLPAPVFLSAKPIEVDLSDVTPGYDDYLAPAPKASALSAVSECDIAYVDEGAAAVEEAAVAFRVAAKAATPLALEAGRAFEVAQQVAAVAQPAFAETALESPLEAPALEEPVCIELASEGPLDAEPALAAPILGAALLAAPVALAAPAAKAPAAEDVLPQMQISPGSIVAFVVCPAALRYCATINRHTLFVAQTGGWQCATISGTPLYRHFSAWPWSLACARLLPLPKAAQLKPSWLLRLNPWRKSLLCRNLTMQVRQRFQPTMTG